jgi:hypothetical protein
VVSLAGATRLVCTYSPSVYIELLRQPTLNLSQLYGMFWSVWFQYCTRYCNQLLPTGVHIGNPQTANLGDGNGSLNEIKVIRQDFGDPSAGTCLESVIGGNHFRYWRQNGPTANSGALFLAYVSSTFSSIKLTISYTAAYRTKR